MFASIFLQAPAESTNFMVAGYAVIFGVMFLYIVSLVLRSRNLRRQMITLKELEEKNP
jgi:hypothetical protein